MYNFLLAFVICGGVLIFGEIISKLTKAWVPSVFASAVLLLIGYWTVLPHDLVKNSFLIPFGSTLAVFLLITHLGTIISLKQLIAQWRTVTICLAGLAGMCVFAYFVAPLFIDQALVIAGLPPLTGGIIAATMMQKAATDAGLAVAAVFAISMYCVQGFAGYPLTSLCLNREGNRLLKLYRAGEIKIDMSEVVSVGEVTKLPDGDGATVRLPLQIPDEWNSPIVILTKLGVVSYIALMLGIYTGISGAIWALILGVVFCRLGFLDPNSLVKANSFNILMFAIIMFVFDGLKDCTPQMLVTIIGPMVILIALGLVGMVIGAFIASKCLKVSFNMAFANCLTALYGFPFDQVITMGTCNALAKNKDEYEFLMSKMFPSMIVGGFVTVTITSVFIAGIFAKML